MPRKKNEEETTDGAPSAEVTQETPAEQVESAVEAEKPKSARKTAAPKTYEVGNGASTIASSKTSSKRAEKVGIVASDKMMKTVVVRVDRLVKHPVYRKYVKRRKKFMAHDELGAKIGDKVKIVETRPMSARKRWRVVEIIQKAEL